MAKLFAICAGALLMTAVVAPVVVGAPLVLRYQLTGGRCQEGPCRRTYTLDTNGVLSYADQTGKSMSKSIKKDELASLIQQINAADYQQIRANRNDEGCPSDADGQDAAYTFYTPRGSQAISNCAIKIDPAGEPFASVQGIIERYMPDQTAAGAPQPTER